MSASLAFSLLILVYPVVGLWHSAQQGTGSSEIAAQECWRTGIWCWFCWLRWASTWGLLCLLSLYSGYIIIASNVNKVWMLIPPRFCCHDSMSTRESSWIHIRCKCIELNEKERQTGWLCGLVYRTVTSKFLELFLHLRVIQIASSHADPHLYLNHSLWVGILCLSWRDWSFARTTGIVRHTNLMKCSQKHLLKNVSMKW